MLTLHWFSSRTGAQPFDSLLGWPRFPLLQACRRLPSHLKVGTRSLAVQAMVPCCQQIRGSWKRSLLLTEECGNAAVEYAIICGLIGTVSIGALVVLGEGTKAAFQQARSAIHTQAESTPMNSETELEPASEQDTPESQ